MKRAIPKTIAPQAWMWAAVAGLAAALSGCRSVPWSSPEADFGCLVTNDTVTITNYLGSGGDVVIPRTIGGLPVTDIGPSAFAQQESLASIEIPEGVTNIGVLAFIICPNLTAASIPGSVAQIGDEAFWYCIRLQRLVIRDGVRVIPPLAFQDCWSLTEVAIPNSVTDIAGGAFDNCSNLVSVTIGSGLTNLASGAFHDCPRLQAARFRGNAPATHDGPQDPDPFGEDVHPVIYHLPATTGWSNSFSGRPTAIWYPQSNATANAQSK